MTLQTRNKLISISLGSVINPLCIDLNLYIYIYIYSNRCHIYVKYGMVNLGPGIDIISTTGSWKSVNL